MVLIASLLSSPLQPQSHSGALVRAAAYPVVREPLQQRMLRNVALLRERVEGIASKGKKMTRELKEYFR
jgi:hypothetical protein